MKWRPERKSNSIFHTERSHIWGGRSSTRSDYQIDDDFFVDVKMDKSQSCQFTKSSIKTDKQRELWHTLTSGETPKSELLLDVFLEKCCEKNIQYICNDEVFPIEDIEEYFTLSATIRKKRSGSQKLPKKDEAILGDLINYRPAKREIKEIDGNEYIFASIGVRKRSKTNNETLIFTLTKKYNSLTFIDLFAGIGGMRLALESFGYKCVFTSEIDKYALQTYSANFEKTEPVDITKLAAEDVPAHDIMCFGFPCQAFSIAGKKLGFEDVTKGTLFFDAMRIAKHHKPKILIAENVKNLVSHDNGNTLQTILNAYEELGYNAYYEVLNSKNFGLPQNRERIYLIGIRKGIDNNSFKIPTSNGADFKTVSNILDMSIDKYKDIEVDYLDPTAPTNPQRPHKIGEAHGGGQGNRIYSIDAIGPTLTAQGGGLGGKTGLYYIPDCGIRGLSPRESARMQGFPENFKIVCSDAQSLKQFGNSLSVPIPTEIIKTLINSKIL